LFLNLMKSALRTELIPIQFSVIIFTFLAFYHARFELDCGRISRTSAGTFYEA